MKWQIPAKTFLVGEYSAVAEESAIILTTEPCFELSIISNNTSSEIHPESPAGLWWQQQGLKLEELVWHDPYQGRGGLGASSAQFLACYLSACAFKKLKPNLNDALNAYYQSSWSGIGLRPSGYDVIAQSQQSCVFINKQQRAIQSYPWVFKNLSFFIVHTGIKQATHQHLKVATLPAQIPFLSSIVDKAKTAFEYLSEETLISSVNDYHYVLRELHLINSNSLALIEIIKQYPEVLAIKGCGALGADTLLILTQSNNKLQLADKLKSQGLLILATEDNLTATSQQALIANSL